MRLFITDTETTGLKPKECDLIEVAALVVDTESWTILESYQSLLHAKENACEHINNISPIALRKMPEVQKDDAGEVLTCMANDSDFIIAHNAPFDKGFYEHNGIVFSKPWVCSRADIKYPGTHKSMRLGHLCYDFNIPIFNAHSAIFDCYYLKDLLKNVPDLEEQLKNMVTPTGEKIPKDRYVALVSFEDKEKAKEAGFAWSKSGRVWAKEMTEEEAKALKATVDFTFRKA